MGTTRLSLSFRGPFTDSRTWIRRARTSTCSQRRAKISPVRRPARTPMAKGMFSGGGSSRKMRRTSATFSMNGVVRGSCVGFMSRRVERGRPWHGLVVATLSSTKPTKSAERSATTMRMVAVLSPSARFASMKRRINEASTSCGFLWPNHGFRCFFQRSRSVDAARCVRSRLSKNGPA
jgi:hypothetical protein